MSGTPKQRYFYLLTSFTSLVVFSFCYKSMSSRLHSITKAWETTQVELRGRYSAERVLALTKYSDETSWLRVILVLLITPLPCLGVTVLVDFIPLAELSEGIEGNTMYFVRTFYTFLVITFLAVHQFRMSVCVLPYPLWRAIGNTMLVSALSVGILYGFALVIGFPLPFSLLTTTPLWCTLISITMVFEWASKIRTTPGAGTMLYNAIKLWMCEVLLVFVYPPYFYVFTTLSGKAQMAFALLLPAIKMCMRNLFSRTILHLTDELPEVVIFNCDVFNALFVAYCMQNSPSIWTTLEIMAVNIVTMGVSLRDTDAIKRSLNNLEHKINWDCHRDSAGKENRGMNTLERASVLLRLRKGVKQETRVSSFLELKRVAPHVDAAFEPPRQKERKRSFVVSARKPARRFLSGQLPDKPVTRWSVRQVVPAAGSRMPILPVTTQYTRRVQRLLYMAEFLLLLNYVEVVIPLVFSIYLYAMYHLPNREYYAQLHGMNEDELIHTLNNVLFYCSLQLVSLLLLFVALKAKLGFSPIHHLAFILDKQVVGVQLKLVFWVYYNAQASLDHSGYDYSFKFPWLQRGPAVPSD